MNFRFFTGIDAIPAAVWNSLAQGGGPFLRHEFLAALEDSGSVCEETGWQPHHLLVSRGNTPVAAMPLYIKHHSYGEYVFDWSWADAWHRNGVAYYPKLLTAIPFTPSQSSRLLIHPEEDRDALTQAICHRVQEEAQSLGASSWHVLFPRERESARLVEQSMPQRTGTQFQWFNRNYGAFEDFLAAFNSRKRKNLRKERQAVTDAGIHFVRYRGEQISDEQWQQFYRFYQNTYHVREQQPYLSLAFFRQLGKTMPESVLLVMALLEGEAIAAALSLFDDTTLYGRYWGCLEEYQFLHFETCYYQGIEFCIEHGLQRFDSGAQGEHKIQRGFEPVSTYSNHWIADPRFAQAIADFLHQEREYVEQYRHGAAQLLPFRQL